MSLVARHAFPTTAFALVLGSLLSLGAGNVHGQVHGQAPVFSASWHTMMPGWQRPYIEESQPDVFFNHYVPGNGGNPAAAYPTPYPTPPRVGHTYFTYQPFMPSEWMYCHHRTYHQYYNSGMGLNRTRVRWYAPPLITAVKGIRKHFTLPR